MSNMMSNVKIRLLVIALLLFGVKQMLAQQANGAMFAVSNGKGQISLLWFPPPSQWPAGGWKLIDSTGQTLAPKIAMADENALQALSVEDADAIRRMPSVLATRDASPKRAQLFNIVGLRAMIDPAYAKAIGISWTLQNVPAGSRTYSVQGIDVGGSPSGPLLTSPAVDSHVPTALPPSPDGLQSKTDERGVLLSWAPPTENRQLPAIAYVIERDGGGQNGAAVTAKPIVPGVKWDPKIPLALDTKCTAERDAHLSRILPRRIWAPQQSSLNTHLLPGLPCTRAAATRDCDKRLRQSHCQLAQRAKAQSCRLRHRTRLPCRRPV